MVPLTVYTMASVLVEGDLPTISEILRHADADSTAVYMKIDIKRLKECAPPEQGVNYI